MNNVWFGDCRESMKQMLAEGVRVQMCVTSPPYFGLRDYGHECQIGLEATPGEYVATMVEVFRLVRELLADDGVLWLNLGDTYFSTTKGTGGSNPDTSPFQARKGKENGQAFRPIRLSAGEMKIKPKDLIGIPWRVAFALQENGWYLRQDIIWHKPNPMPESVTDRCTKAHEYMFLLSKSERYYYDADAIREPHAETSLAQAKRNRFGGKYKGLDKNEHGSLKRGGHTGNPDKICTPGGRNKRSVWTIPTKPYNGAHFAVFPPALIEPCVLAGSRKGDVVLDPFFGSGTTGDVAQRLGRRWIGCELNRDYESLQRQRTAQGSLEI